MRDDDGLLEGVFGDADVPGQPDEGGQDLATLEAEDFIEVEWILSEIDPGVGFEVLRAEQPDGEYRVVEDGEFFRNRLQFRFRDRSFDSGATVVE